MLERITQFVRETGPDDRARQLDPASRQAGLVRDRSHSECCGAERRLERLEAVVDGDGELWFAVQDAGYDVDEQVLVCRACGRVDAALSDELSL